MAGATSAPVTATATLATLGIAPTRPQSPAMRFFDGAAERTLTFGQLADEVSAVARGLMAIGVKAGDRVGILANTRAEWTIADLAILATGAICVPVYQTNSPEECQYVIENSEMSVLLCENADQLTKIAGIRAQCPSLTQLLAIEDATGDVLSLDALKARGSEITAQALTERAQSVTPDQLATIVYTSGTTGPPKGVMLSHHNLTSDVAMNLERLPHDGHERHFVFLPLAHVLTRVVQFLALTSSSQLLYWRRDPATLLDEIAAARPTHLPSVPRLFEKIYTAAHAKTAAAGGAKAAIFTRAVATGRRVAQAQREGRPIRGMLAIQHRLADKLVLSKVRDLFGGEIELCLTGAAPIEPAVMEFFIGAGVPVVEGYGMSETSAVASINAPDDYRLGTVGRPLPGCEIRIAEDGEVLMRGANIFSGYWRNEKATAKDLQDGWLHSGDLGEIDGDGFLTITGRKKDLIITSSGKNVAPSNIENGVRQHRWVSQCVVYGDRRPYLTALITLDPDEAPALAEQVGASGASVAELADHPGARAVIEAVIDEVNQRFARIEQIKRFVILPRDLTQEQGELTPTLKVKRNIVYRDHAERFDALYEGAAEG